MYGNMNPINIPPMLVYIPYMDPMGWKNKIHVPNHQPATCFCNRTPALRPVFF